MNRALFKFPILTTAVLAGCIVANAQEKRVDLTAGAVEISVVLPTGLEPFSEEKMALVREKGIAAKFIFSDLQGELIAAINTFGSGADEKGLSRLGEQIEADVKKHSSEVGGLTRELITMNGKKWLRLSFREGAGEAELVNEYFITDWIGQYVLLNFSAPIAKYESYKSAVERSARSVQLGFIAESIELSPSTAPAKKN